MANFINNRYFIVVMCVFVKIKINMIQNNSINIALSCYKIDLKNKKFEISFLLRLSNFLILPDWALIGQKSDISKYPVANTPSLFSFFLRTTELSRRFKQGELDFLGATFMAAIRALQTSFSVVSVPRKSFGIIVR